MTDEMERFIENHPEFSEIYERTKAMMKTREDLLNEAAHMMYTEDIVESLKKTYATRARKLERKVEELQIPMLEITCSISISLFEHCLPRCHPALPGRKDHSVQFP